MSIRREIVKQSGKGSEHHGHQQAGYPINQVVKASVRRIRREIATS